MLAKSARAILRLSPIGSARVPHCIGRSPIGQIANPSMQSSAKESGPRSHDGSRFLKPAERQATPCFRTSAPLGLYGLLCQRLPKRMDRIDRNDDPGIRGLRIRNLNLVFRGCQASSWSRNAIPLRKRQDSGILAAAWPPLGRRMTCVLGNPAAPPPYGRRIRRPRRWISDDFVGLRHVENRSESDRR